MSPHETAARERKAAKLLLALDLATAGRGENPVTAAARLVRVLRGWTDADWSRLAAVAGTRAPSQRTRGHIVAAIERRAATADRLTEAQIEASEDPFARGSA